MQTHPQGYRTYVLGLLLAVGIVAWVDRNVFSMVLESIKFEFDLSDTQMGLLGGAAFGIFYATVGLPVAWLADRYNRRSIIALALGLWSLATAGCGTSSGFVTLFLARVGVGVGEAGSAPPSHSLISDYFPAEVRGFALGVLYLYIPLGFLIGFLSAGWLNEAYGWRMTFLIVGLPGVLLALIVRLTLREPKRGAADNITVPKETPSLFSTLSFFWSRPTLRHLPMAGAIHGIGAFAAAVWLPTYFARIHGLGSGEIGTWMALAYGGGGGIGVLLGGYVLDSAVRRTKDPRWYAWGSTGFMVLSVPFLCLIYMTDLRTLSFAALLISTMFGHMHLGPITAMMQNLAGIKQRAMAAAYFLFLVNLISTTIGPVSVGAASDIFSPSLGTDALRYTLLTITVCTSLWAGVHFILAAQTLCADLSATARADAAD